MRTIVLGPPGTGKTTTLLNKVESYLKKTDPNRIGYFAFTTKAAYEARDRAMKKFNFTEDDLPYFRTLHSLAFNLLGIRREQVMQDHHYKDLGEKIGFPVKYAQHEFDHHGFFTSDSPYLNLIERARLKGITPEQEYDSGSSNGHYIERDKLRLIASEIQHYKKDYGLKDYTDMIVEFTKSNRSPSFDVIFIDEAQDLSPVQWKMAEVVENKSQDSFIAGDDNQAIFTWAGADVNKFIALKGNYEYLTQSWRVPRKVHELAADIISRLQTRIDKNWKPKTNEGELRFYNQLDHIDMSKGEWLVLARTRFMLNDVEKSLTEQGLYFRNRFKTSYDKPLQEAVYDFNQWQNGSPLQTSRIKNIYDFMSPENLVNEYKDGKTLDPNRHYHLEDCINNHGLKINKDLSWYHAFDDASYKKKDLIKAMLARGEKLDKDPRIVLSTIHGSKGGECDNVVLLTDMTENTMKNYENNPDDENRLFYVGATRTKKALHIVDPKLYHKSFKI